MEIPATKEKRAKLKNTIITIYYKINLAVS